MIFYAPQYTPEFYKNLNFRIPQEPPKPKTTLIRSASDSTWKNYIKIHPDFIQRLSYDFIYHNIGYSNYDQNYIKTDDSEISSDETSRSSKVRSLSFDGSMEENSKCAKFKDFNKKINMKKRSIDTEEPYARLHYENQFMKFKRPKN